MTSALRFPFQPGRVDTAVRLKSLYIDPFLLLICLTLIGIGFVMVASSSLHLGKEYAGNILMFPKRQLMNIVLGLITASVVINLPMKFWEQTSAWLFIFGIALLVIVLIPGVGVNVNNSVRWLSLFGMRFQVSELVKFFTVIYMAGYLMRHIEDLQQSAYGIVKPLLLLSIACVLLLQQPDFGASVVIMVIAMGMMFLGGAQIKQFLILIASVAAMAALLISSSTYRASRVISFLDPWADAKDGGFQLTQALISFGRGDVFGVGLGNGLQKWFYVPEAHTDFLFSVMAEELGLISVLTVIFLYALFFRRSCQIGEQAAELGFQFNAYVAYGIAIWMGFQSFVNMGVNMGVLPTKGITLPFMSYGGSSMLVMCIAIAVLFRINSENQAYLNANAARAG